MFILFTLNFASARAQVASVVINELNPASGRVELINTSSEDVDLSGWELYYQYGSEDPDNLVSQTVSLNSTIPANGLIIRTMSEIRSDKGNLLLYNASSEFAVHSIQYGAFDPEYSTPDSSAPSGDDSLIQLLGSWTFASSSIGWFNDAGEEGAAPILSNVADTLSDSGILTNLGTIDDPTEAGGLYFDLEGVGRLEINDSLNLSSEENVATLANLGSNLVIANKVLEFNPETGSTLKSAGATLTLRGLTADYATSSLSVTENSATVDTNSAIDSLTQDPETKDVTISAMHFTRFELVDTPAEDGEDPDEAPADTTSPEISILSPLADAWATSSLSLVAEASDDTGVTRVEFFLDDDISLGEVTSAGEDGNYTLSWDPIGEGLADGDHYLFARAFDAAGNQDESGSQILHVDATLPVGTLDYDETAPTRLDVIATMATNRAVRLDGEDTYQSSFTHTFTENGSYTFNFTDEVGHPGSETATVTNIDRTSPIISGVLPLAGSRVSQNTSLSFDDSEYFLPKCSVDPNPSWGSKNFMNCSATFGQINMFNLLSEGPFTLYIKDTDESGNTGTTSASYIKDSTAPFFVAASSTGASTVIVEFSEDLDEDRLDILDFLGTYNGQDNNITAFGEDNGLVTLTMETAFAETDPISTLTLNPIAPMSIKDLAENELTERLTVDVADGITPTLLSAVTSGSRTITMTFSEDLRDTVLASTVTAYSIRNGATVALPVATALYSSQTITIQLNEDMVYGDTIRVNLSSNHNLRDLSGNTFNSGSAFTTNVTNNLGQNTEENDGGGGGGGGGGGSSSATPSEPAPTPTDPNIGGGSVLGAKIFIFTRNLSYCTKDNDVLELQKRLKAEGYFTAAILTDYFGDQTLSAVKRYQSAHKLPVTGFFGPMTRAVLNGATDDGSLQAQINSIYEQLLNIQNLLKDLVATGIQ